MAEYVWCQCDIPIDVRDVGTCLVCAIAVCEDCAIEHAMDHVRAGTLCAHCMQALPTHRHIEGALCNDCARASVNPTCTRCEQDRVNAHAVVRRVRHAFNNAAGAFHDIPCTTTRDALTQAMDDLDHVIATRDAIERAWRDAS
jgi:hypothetical protein